MQQEKSRKPVPQPTAISAPYWEGAEQGKLLLQRCAGCGKVRHYPRLICDQCYSFEVDWIEASGRGKVHSWTVAHHAFHPAFADEVPYVLVTVDLEEGVRALGRMPAGSRVRIDMPVQGRLEKNQEGTPLPVFSAVTE